MDRALKVLSIFILTYIDYRYIIPYIDNLYKRKTEGNIMAVDKSLISGSTSMLLLRLLEEKDMYGYEMIETLEKKSNNVFTLKAGTLYPLLHSLEEKNYLKSYESEANGKTRKYYSITKEGKKYLKSKKEEWNEYQTAVANVLCFAK
jgi:DNA-binding PadR family transcriptional regulator